MELPIKSMLTPDQISRIPWLGPRDRVPSYLVCYVLTFASRKLFWSGGLQQSSLFWTSSFRWLLILWRVLCVVDCCSSQISLEVFSLICFRQLLILSASAVSNSFYNFLNSFCFFVWWLVLFASCFGYHLSDDFLIGVILPDLSVMRVSNFCEPFFIVLRSLCNFRELFRVLSLVIFFFKQFSLLLIFEFRWFLIFLNSIGR